MSPSRNSVAKGLIAGHLIGLRDKGMLSERSHAVKDDVSTIRPTRKHKAKRKRFSGWTMPPYGQDFTGGGNIRLEDGSGIITTENDESIRTE